MERNLDQRLHAALSRDADECRAFETSRLSADLAGDWRSCVLLFGAGPLGLRILSGLRKLGIEPVAFVDNQPAKWGTACAGVPVLSPGEATQTYGKVGSFIVCVWRAGSVLQQLADAGCRYVTQFKALFWQFPDEYLPNMRVDRAHLILKQREQVRAAYANLSDEVSRSEFVTQIEWLLAFDFGSLAVAGDREQYFDDRLFKRHSGETFVDCGAYTGDTLEGFLRFHPNPKAMHAFEPEPHNLRALQSWRARQPAHIRDRVQIHPYAAAAGRQRLRFQADGVGSAVDASGALEVQAVPLDEELAGRPVTFIKMDIEGAEPDAIAGASRLIASNRPVLAVCLYHRQEHIYSIPNQLQRLVGDFRFFLRRYGDQFGDLVCYAVPPERLQDTSP